MKVIRCLVLLAMVSGVLQTYAGVYHVAKTGDDRSGTGSSGAPWLTIQHGADNISAGDTLMIHAGVYREAVEPPAGGNETGGPVVYRAYPGDSVSLCGTEIITGTWTQCTAGSHPQFPDPEKVWYADVDTAWLQGLYEDSYIRMDQLFQDGERLVCAHWPDQTDPDMTYDKDEGHLVTGSSDAVSVIDNVHLTQADDFWNGAVLKVLFGSGVGETHLYDIVDFDNAAGTITVDGDLRRTPSVGEDAYAVMNHPRGLDMPGEFCIDYDLGRIYLITHGEDDPNGHEIEISVRGSAIDLGYMNAGYLTFDGLEIRGFRGTGIHHYNLSYGDERNLVIRNCTIRQNLGNGIRIDISVALTGFVIEGNRIHDNDNKGLYFGTRSGSIDSMRIIDNILDRDNNDDAMQIGGTCSNVLLKNNYVGRHHGVKGHTDGFKFGVMTGNFTNWTFDGNIFTDNLMDWGMAGYGPYNNLVFINNVFSGGKHFHVREGEVNGMVFINNTIYAPWTGLMYFGDNTTGLVVKNNVFDVRDYGLNWGTAAPEKDHNFYIGDLPADAGTGALAGDSTVLADAGNGDYRPAGGVSLIDAGTDVSAYGVDHDLAGNARPNGSGWDMGAYEYYADNIADNRLLTADSPHPACRLANPCYSSELRYHKNVIRVTGRNGKVNNGLVLIKDEVTGTYKRIMVIH